VRPQLIDAFVMEIFLDDFTGIDPKGKSPSEIELDGIAAAFGGTVAFLRENTFSCTKEE
jgi:hypothetical protein